MDMTGLWNLVGSTLFIESKLQPVLNAAVKVVYSGNKYDHVISLVPNKLHLLRIPEGIIYKLSADILHNAQTYTPRTTADILRNAQTYTPRTTADILRNVQTYIPRLLSSRGFVIKRISSISQAVISTV